MYHVRSYEKFIENSGWETQREESDHLGDVGIAGKTI
jgi:hypothetical protein